MAFSGNFVNAETAESWGLVNRVLPPEELLPAALALAADMASAEPGMLRAYKRLIDEGFDLPMGGAMALEARRSSEWAAVQTPEELARRRAVQERGRGRRGEPVRLLQTGRSCSPSEDEGLLCRADSTGRCRPSTELTFENPLQPLGHVSDGQT